MLNWWLPGCTYKACHSKHILYFFTRYTYKNTKASNENPVEMQLEHLVRIGIASKTKANFRDIKTILSLRQKQTLGI